jgi:hypothetical protein
VQERHGARFDAAAKSIANHKVETIAQLSTNGSRLRKS